jgi:HEAT repeat protein
MYDLTALQEEAPQVRLAAVKLTPPLGSGRDRLRSALARDPDPGVRAGAARQLGAGDDYATTSALLGALEDPETSVVKSAIEALVDIGDPSVVPALQAALDEHPDQDVQRALRLASERLQQGARRDPELPSLFEYQRPAGAEQVAAAPEQTTGHSEVSASAH